MFAIEDLDEVMSGGGCGLVYGVFELRDKCVEDRRRRGVSEERRVKQVTPFQHDVRMLLLHEVVQPVRRPEILQGHRSREHATRGGRCGCEDSLECQRSTRCQPQ